MPVKAYISDVFVPLSVQWQETVLAAVPEWPGEVEVFRDTVNRRARQKQSPDDLVGRAELLRAISTEETDTIYLASLTVLAWDENDFRATLADILGRPSVTLVALDDGLTVDRSMPLEKVIQAWKRARKRRRVITAQIKGSRASAERKKAKSMAGVEKIRPYWGKSSEEYPTLMLRQMAGTVEHPMAYNTIVAHIGYGRAVAQKQDWALAKDHDWSLDV